jgi:hypothetical protein
MSGTSSRRGALVLGTAIALGVAVLWLLGSLASARGTSGTAPAPARPRAGGERTSPRIVPVESPAPPGSAQPHLAAGPDGAFILSWLETDAGGRTRFRYATRTQEAWSPPVLVAEGTDFFVNWADVPSVVQLSGGRLAAHWLQKSGGGSPYAYDVRLRVSDDGGATWSSPVTPHRDGTKTEHGFVSLFEAPGGALGLVWLDGRNMAAGGHHGEDQGAMTLRAATLDAALALGNEHVVDDRVCECCPTTAVRAGDSVVVAYRDRGEGAEIRDIFVSRFVGGSWTPGRAVHRDGWLMPACPVNGPSLSADGRRVALAWFTAEGNEPRALVAFSEDAGATWGPPVRVDDGVALGRVDSELVPDGSALVAWIEFAEGQSSLRARRVRPDGAKDPSFEVAGVSGDRASGYPRMARSGGTVLFAWTETQPVKRVRLAALALR